MARVALLSNPRSTGNRSLLPRVRSFCARHRDIFHYEVEDADQIGAALRTIARVKPKVLVINGGDGTVQAALTELYHGGHFEGGPPPVAVLPNGKTNLIAHDLGADGDPLRALERVLAIASDERMDEHVVSRELIALSGGGGAERPVLGMFLGGAGLADSILYCRHKIYPLGLPNGFSHLLAALATFCSAMFGLRAAFLPPRPSPVSIRVPQQGELSGRFQFLMVTTLERLLFHGHVAASAGGPGGLRLMAVERRPVAMVRALFAAMLGKLGRQELRGVHLESGEEIRIEGDHSSVILDGELFEARPDRPIILKPAPAFPFLRLAA
jgi:hypothetical protein